MKVKIEDNLYIEGDGRQYTLKQYTGKKSSEGREDYVIHGYFGTIESAVKKVVKLKISESTASTLAELVDEIKRIRNYVESKFNGE
ncbi:hypothetical protein P4631_09280 [Halalkalibacterium halodurans]|uniref:hypothetical protein n=1 Tax=Halalkalibacterium halodurans TaxID=86665 RepID=UPI002E1D8025|nr:hypothetical protein [Halalkalibacterium halodurans]